MVRPARFSASRKLLSCAKLGCFIAGSRRENHCWSIVARSRASGSSGVRNGGTAPDSAGLVGAGLAAAAAGAGLGAGAAGVAAGLGAAAGLVDSLRACASVSCTAWIRSSSTRPNSSNSSSSGVPSGGLLDVCGLPPVRARLGGGVASLRVAILASDILNTWVAPINGRVRTSGMRKGRASRVAARRVRGARGLCAASTTPPPVWRLDRPP